MNGRTLTPPQQDIRIAAGRRRSGVCFIVAPDYGKGNAVSRKTAESN